MWFLVLVFVCAYCMCSYCSAMKIRSALAPASVTLKIPCALALLSTAQITTTVIIMLFGGWAFIMFEGWACIMSSEVISTKGSTRISGTYTSAGANTIGRDNNITCIINQVGCVSKSIGTFDNSLQITALRSKVPHQTTPEVRSGIEHPSLQVLHAGATQTRPRSQPNLRLIRFHPPKDLLEV